MNKIQGPIGGIPLNDYVEYKGPIGGPAMDDLGENELMDELMNESMNQEYKNHPVQVSKSVSNANASANAAANAAANGSTFAIGELVTVDHGAIQCVRICDYDQARGYQVSIVTSSDGGQRPETMWWKKCDLERLANRSQEQANTWKDSSIGATWFALLAEQQKRAGGVSIDELMLRGLKKGHIIKAAVTSSWIRKGDEFMIGDPEGRLSVRLCEQKHTWFELKGSLIQGIGSELWCEEFRLPKESEKHPAERYRTNKIVILTKEEQNALDDWKQSDTIDRYDKNKHAKFDEDEKKIIRAWHSATCRLLQLPACTCELCVQIGG